MMIRVLQQVCNWGSHDAAEGVNMCYMPLCPELTTCLQTPLSGCALHHTPRCVLHRLRAACIGLAQPATLVVK